MKKNFTTSMDSEGFKEELTTLSQAVSTKLAIQHQGGFGIRMPDWGLGR